MTTLTRPRLDPLLDAPLVGPSTFAIVPDGAGYDGCSMWRVFQPFWALHLRGYPVSWDRRLRAARLGRWHTAGQYDAHLICRAAAMPDEQRQMAGWFRQMRDAGKTVIYECDDDLFTPFSTEQLRKRVRGAPPRAQLEAERAGSLWAVERCDGATVTTQHLASVLRQYTDIPVEVVPNAIDAEWFARLLPRARRTVPRPTIGWAGGRRPDADVEEMAVAWGRLARSHPRVTFVVQGPVPDPIARHVPPGRLRALPWMSILEYPTGLVNIDIGCCPLEERPFNRCKTPIKAWEYALAGAAVVASPTVYRQCIRDGENGFIARDAREWEFCLARLLEVDDHRRELAAALKQEVLERWSLAQNVWRWPAAWNRLRGGKGA